MYCSEICDRVYYATRISFSGKRHSTKFPDVISYLSYVWHATTLNPTEVCVVTFSRYYLF